MTYRRAYAVPVSCVIGSHPLPGRDVGRDLALAVAAGRVHCGMSPGCGKGLGAAGHRVRRGIRRLPTEQHPAWIEMTPVVV